MKSLNTMQTHARLQEYNIQWTCKCMQIYHIHVVIVFSASQDLLRWAASEENRAIQVRENTCICTVHGIFPQVLAIVYIHCMYNMFMYRSKLYNIQLPAISCNSQYICYCKKDRLLLGQKKTGAKDVDIWQIPFVAFLFHIIAV